MFTKRTADVKICEQEEVDNVENTNAANLTEHYWALIVGILFLVVGIAGFIPAFVSISGTNVPNIPTNKTHSAYALE